MAHYLVIDTETGGTLPGRHSLLEVGMAAYKDGVIVDTDSFYIREEEYLVTPKAMEINKLNLANVYLKGVTPSAAVNYIQNFVMRNFGFEKPAMMLGHNPRFDRDFIKQMFLDYNEDIDKWIHYRTVDTMTMIQVARDMGWLPQEAPTSLLAFAKFMGYEPKGEHTALGDVGTTIWVYEKLLDIFKEAKPWQSDLTTELLTSPV